MPVPETSSHPSLAREDQLAWKIAVLATDKAATPKDVVNAIINRLIDNAGVAIAALNLRPVIAARGAALGHLKKTNGAALFGCRPRVTVSPEWAAWANSAAVRALGLHDNLPGDDDVHPAETIPAILAVAQAAEASGKELIRGIAAAYEVQAALAKAITLPHTDPIAHLAPAQVAGIGAVLGLKPELIYQAVQHTVPLAFIPRTPEGASPAYAAKLAVEAVDRALRGETTSGPAFEALLSREAVQNVTLPGRGEARRAILETYAKEHAAPSAAQVFIDLAFRLHEQVEDAEAIEAITLHSPPHTHAAAGGELPTLFAVALQDGFWHFETSVAPRRANRPDTVRLAAKIATLADPDETAAGARVELVFTEGTALTDELDVANAHPHGANPFGREDYIRKFLALTDGVITRRESNRFLEAVQNLPRLSAGELGALNIALPAGALDESKPGIF